MRLKAVLSILMPTAACEYCSAIVGVKSMYRHQKSKSCLAAQKRLGLNPNPTILTCKCGFFTAIKCQFEKHIPRCEANETTPESSRELGISKPVVTNGQLFESIRTKIQSLEPEIVEQGISHMMQCISSSFKSQDMWIVRIADPSRNKFSFIENGVEIVDIKGIKITTLIRHEFIKITILLLKQARETNNKNRIIKLENLASTLQENEYYNQIIKGLMGFLPKRFEDNTADDIQMEDSLKTLKQLTQQNKNDEKESSNGFIYVIKEREFVKTGENVFKIGRTYRQVGERLCEYPKGSNPYYFENCENCEKIEGTILKKLISIPTEFKHRQDIGNEYFEGNIKRLIFIIKSITIDEYMSLMHRNDL